MFYNLQWTAESDMRDTCFICSRNSYDFEHHGKVKTTYTIKLGWHLPHAGQHKGSRWSQKVSPSRSKLLIMFTSVSTVITKYVSLFCYTQSVLYIFMNCHSMCLHHLMHSFRDSNIYNTSTLYTLLVHPLLPHTA